VSKGTSRARIGHVPKTIRSCDIEAEIYYLPPEHGGRSTPAFSGYRPQFYYRGRDWDAQHEYLDTDRALPGETVRAHIEFLAPAQHLGKVVEGMPFLLREGNRTVGYGSVLKIIDLPQSAARDSSRDQT
jgi:elongation factor Tu